MFYGGMHGLFLAADTAAASQSGQVTDFVKKTILLQFPAAGGIVPRHIILHSESCTGNELVLSTGGKG